jgi:hypothetical protein
MDFGTCGGINSTWEWSITGVLSGREPSTEFICHRGGLLGLFGCQCHLDFRFSDLRLPQQASAHLNVIHYCYFINTAGPSFRCPQRL